MFLNPTYDEGLAVAKSLCFNQDMLPLRSPHQVAPLAIAASSTDAVFAMFPQAFERRPVAMSSDLWRLFRIAPMPLN